jgi:hypothetical protein
VDVLRLDAGMTYRLLSETQPKARKAYRCVWCGYRIPEGERHVHERSIFDGEFQNHRWHPECLDAMREQAREEGGEVEFGYHDNPRGGRPE